jgi:hypothetical protein
MRYCDNKTNIPPTIKTIRRGTMAQVYVTLKVYNEDVKFDDFPNETYEHLAQLYMGMKQQGFDIGAMGISFTIKNKEGVVAALLIGGESDDE